MTEIYAVVLAAGKGTRMNSDLAKVLHPVADRPMLEHVLDVLEQLGADESVVVVGHQADRVGELCAARHVSTVLQEPQLGTGHAVEQARSLLEGRNGWTMILCGDVPLLREETLGRLLESCRDGGAAAAVLTAVTDDASGYGRILRDSDGGVKGIVEEKDATDQQRRIREYNTGTYCFENRVLWPALSRLDQDNAQGEFYLTDVIAMLVEQGLRVEGVICEDEREVQGVNTVEDLARAERDMLEMKRG